MRACRILIPLCLLSCSAELAPAPADIDARWSLKAGDTLAIRISLEFTGGDPISRSELIGRLAVREIGADGAARGGFTTQRFELVQEGDPAMRVLYEKGELKESKGFEESAKLLAGLRSTIEARLLPSGLLHPVGPDAPRFFSGWPLGAELPGRKIAAAGSWSGLLRAAHCDELKTEYRFVTTGERMKIEGRSTPAEEESHKIRARVEATYLPAQGIVSEGRIEFDFSPLGSDRRIIIRCSISRT